MEKQLQFDIKRQSKISKPKMYKLIMHNDDYTPMDFVTSVLIRIFNKSQQEATAMMMEVHQKGLKVIGIYTLDIALTKKMLSEKVAEQCSYPLKITLEEAN